MVPIGIGLLIAAAIIGEWWPVVIGGALIVTGAFLWWTSPTRPRRNR